VSGFPRSPMRETFGTIVASNSNCFGDESSDEPASPVMLPPGCTRLGTRPFPTGSVEARCARAASGHATAAPPNAASNSRSPKHRTRKCLPSLGASQLTRRFI
jgi:hypothetical protein